MSTPLELAIERYVRALVRACNARAAYEQSAIDEVFIAAGVDGVRRFGAEALTAMAVTEARRRMWPDQPSDASCGARRA